MSENEELVDSDGLKQALEVLRERRDEAVGVLEEDLDGVRYVMTETASELDDQLDEYHFDLVQQNVETAVAIIDEIDDDKLHELARLGAIAIGGEVLPALSSGSVPQPPKMVDRRLPHPDPEKWDELKSQDNFVDVLRENVIVCANRIRYLLSYFTDELWPFVIGEAQAGSAQGVDAALAVFSQVAEELRDARELWILWLSELYNEDSSNLGDVGHSVELMTNWLATQNDK